MIKVKASNAQEYNIPVEIKEWKFPAGESGIQFKCNWHEPIDKFCISLRFESNDDLINLLLLVDAIRAEYGANIKLHLNIEYFPYARQDRVMCQGQSHSLRVIVGLIRSCKFSSILVVDPHSDVLESLFPAGELTVFKQVEAIEYSSVFQKYLAKAKSDIPTYLVSPDEGASKKIYKIAEKYGLPVIRASKKRNPATGQIVETVVEDIGIGDTVVRLLVVDDIIDGGRTFIELAKVLLKTYNIERLGLWASHGIFSQGRDVLSDYDDIDVFNDISNTEKQKKD